MFSPDVMMKTFRAQPSRIGMGEASADDVAEHVEDHDVGMQDVEGVLSPEGFERGDDAAARAADAPGGDLPPPRRERRPCLRAPFRRA